MFALIFIQRRITTSLITLLSLIGLTACQSSGDFRTNPLPSNPLSSNQLPTEYHGLWQSNGYGYLIDARQPTVQAYHITPDVCVQDNDIGEAFYSFASQNVEGAKLVATADGKHLYLSEPFEAYQIQFTRLNSLPKTCKALAVNTPKTNFQAFVSYMDTHYAFFDLYNVNWSQVVAEHQHKVTDDMSEEALFALFSTMLEPLKDAHLSLQGTVNGEEQKYHPEISPVGEATQKIAEQLSTSKKKIDRKLFEQYWTKDIQEDILQGKGVMTANDLIQYGISSKDIGYIAIAATYNYADQGLNHDAEDRQQLTQTLDNALTLFNKHAVKAVILDLSINFGGHSFPATDIAARFAEETTVAFSKKAYDAEGLEAFPIQVTVTQQPHFYGPVYVLTGSVTVSGGEEVVLALKALPNVTLVGERTRGALSDILDKRLPNDWNLALSNEIYTDKNGRLWEGDGIPPDIEMPVFDANDPFKGHLDAVDQVIQSIQQDTAN